MASRQAIQACLTEFQDDVWHTATITRLAVCFRGREPIEVVRTGEFEGEPLGPGSTTATWLSAIGFASGRRPLWVPTDGPAIVLIPITTDATLILDCPTGSRVGVVATFARRLVDKLRAIINDGQ